MLYDQFGVGNAAEAVRMPGGLMKLRTIVGVVLSAVVLGCKTVPAAKDAADPLTLMEAVADWQLAHKDDVAIYGTKGRTLETRGWIQGAFFVGLTSLADRSGKPRFARALIDHGDAQQWRLGDRLM